MAKKTIETFLAESTEALLAETTKAFHFLADQYGCGQPEKSIQDPQDIREARVMIKYTSPHIGIQVTWAIAQGFLDAAFVELLQAGIFPSQVSFLPFRDESATAKAVNLRELVDILGHGDNPDLLLKKMDSSRALNKRVKLIETSMPAILAGLARATQTYASSILQGDTTLFPRVMNYHAEKVQKNHPSGSLFFYTLDDPS